MILSRDELIEVVESINSEIDFQGNSKEWHPILDLVDDCDVYDVVSEEEMEEILQNRILNICKYSTEKKKSKKFKDEAFSDLLTLYPELKDVNPNSTSISQIDLESTTIFEMASDMGYVSVLDEDKQEYILVSKIDWM